MLAWWLCTACAGLVLTQLSQRWPLFVAWLGTTNQGAALFNLSTKFSGYRQNCFYPFKFQTQIIHTDDSQMFLHFKPKPNLHFKMNVQFLLVLICLLCQNPEKSRTSFFFLIRFQCVVSTYFFFRGKQSGFRTATSLWSNETLSSFPLHFLDSFFLFLFCV